MKNLIEYLKDKIYYIMGATILLIVILVIISSCSGKGSSYSSIESKMVSAAKSYYASRENKLPKEDGSSIKVTMGTLIDAELIDEIKDPNNKEQTCEGFVQVKKVGDDYAYIPFLTCKGNYEPEYLVDKIKNSKLDEYGNGVYEMGGEYVYRGDDVNNYISFNNQTWRIMRVNSDNEIKIISDKPTESEYSWDISYNIKQDDTVGVTDDYLTSNMRKSLVDYYENSFSDKSKTYIIPKDICIGSLLQTENFNKDKECLKIKDNEYIGLMNISDYQAATLDSNCTNPDQGQCSNKNYLVSSAIVVTWTMNTNEENNYMVYGFSRGTITKNEAASELTINPVIYLSSDVIVSEGNGTKEKPFIVK